MNLKFLYPLIGLILGIYISAEMMQGYGPGLTCLGVALAIWAFLNIKSKNPVIGWKYSKFHFLWVLILFAGIGNIVFQINARPYIEKDIEGESVLITGVIEEVNYLTAGDNFKLKVKSIQDSSKIINSSNLNLLVKTNGYQGSKGDIISFRGNPKKFFSSYKNQKFMERMKQKGILYSVNVKSDYINKIGISSSLFYLFQDYRERLIILLENSPLNRHTSEFLISLLLGEKSFLSVDTRQILSSAGLAHILALSGMHVGIIVSIIFVLLFPLSIMGHRKLCKTIAIILIWLYVLLTGGAPSTVRATIMASFILGAYLLERKNSALNALMAACLIILMVNPLNLWDIGLQLSFLSVASILIFCNRFNPVERHIHPILYSCINLILISVISAVATWALIAYYFQSVPVLFLLSNLLLLPLLPIFVGAGLFYLLLLILNINWPFYSRSLDYFYDFFLKVADIFSFSGKSVININVSMVTVLLWGAGIIILAIAVHSQIKKTKQIAGIISIITFIISFPFLWINDMESSTAIKFKHSFTTMEIEHYKDNEYNKFVFPRKNISGYTHEKFSVLAIDGPVLEDSLKKLGKTDPLKNNYLIVGTSAEMEQIAELIQNADFNGIILHSGIGKNKKAELLRRLDESHWERVYSLRDNGSLEFDL